MSTKIIEITNREELKRNKRKSNNNGNNIQRYCRISAWFEFVRLKGEMPRC